MNSYIALSLIALFFAATLLVIYLVCSALNYARTRRLNAEILKESRQLREGVEHIFDGSLFPPIHVDEFDANDLVEDEEVETEVPDIKDAEFLLSDFPTEQAQRALVDDLRRVDSNILGLRKKTKEDGVVYVVPRYQTDFVKNPEVKPISGMEMQYHTAGHAHAAEIMNQEMFRQVGEDLVKQHNEAVKAWEDLQNIVRSLDSDARAKVRLILDQADADAALEDEEFYQQVVEQEKVRNPKVKKISKKKSKKRR